MLSNHIHYYLIIAQNIKRGIKGRKHIGGNYAESGRLF